MTAITRDLKSEARERLYGKYSLFFLPLFLFFICMLASSMIPALLFPGDTAFSMIMQLTLTFFLDVLLAMLGIGLIRISYEMVSGRPFSFGSLTYAFRNQTDQYLKIELLFSLISTILSLPSIYLAYLYINESLSVAAYYISAIGMTALALFLSSVITMRMQWALYILMDSPNLGAIEAIKKSLALTKGRTLEIFYLTMSFVGIYLLGLCSLFLGFLYVRPYKEITYVLYYLELKKAADPTGV